MKLSQEDFGKKLDPPVSGATVSRWESGEHLPTGRHLRGVLTMIAEMEGKRAAAADEFERRLVRSTGEARIRQRVLRARAQIAEETGEPIPVGGHKVLLLADGSLLVNDAVHVAPDGSVKIVGVAERH